MSVVVDLTITPIQFMKDGKLYNVGEILKNGEHGLTIFLDEKLPSEEQVDTMVVDERSEFNQPISEV